MKFVDLWGLAERELRQLVNEIYVTATNSDLLWNPETKSASIYAFHFGSIFAKGYINDAGKMIVDDAYFINKVTKKVAPKGLDYHPNRDTAIIASIIIIGVKGPSIINTIGKLVDPIISTVSTAIGTVTTPMINKISNAIDKVKTFINGGKITNDILETTRAGSALKLDPYHAFTGIVDNYAGNAVKTPINNGTLYQIQGSLNGIQGRFEWIIDKTGQYAGQVSHRFFIPNGSLNGVPIKK